MATAIIFHDVQDGAVWANAWKKGPNYPNATGILADIPDMAAFQELLQSDEGQKAMREDGLTVETLRVLVAFTPGTSSERCEPVSPWGGHHGWLD